MSAWYFILGSYVVTGIVVVVEVIAVRARLRAARAVAPAGGVDRAANQLRGNDA